jgi:hypothetical protein
MLIGIKSRAKVDLGKASFSKQPSTKILMRGVTVAIYSIPPLLKDDRLIGTIFSTRS